jgi:glycosyltransferase involved in cell wall biosynthesis
MVDRLVKEIMPKVWSSQPGVKLIIVGKDPPRRIRELARNDLVEVTGTVADIRPYLWKATVAVVPLIYGAGIQNKILEAMATETPVVTTTRAISSLHARLGRDVMTGDTADEIASAIIELLGNPVMQKAVGWAGYQYVSENHDWGQIGSQLVAIYDKTVAAQNGIGI